MLIVPRSARLAIVDELIAVGNVLDGALVRLFQNDITPAAANVLTDFVAADFDGYADSAAVTWSAAFTDDANNAITLGDLKMFPCTGNTTPNVIFGYVLFVGTDLLGAERFDSPLAVDQAGDAIPVLPRFSFGQ